MSGVFLFFSVAKELPRPENFTEHQVSQSTKIYDRSGQILLYELYGEEKRTIVPLDKISQNLIRAILATEDNKFYEHHGIDLKSIVRALLVDLRIKKPLYGASTISQQLIRSTFLSREKTIQRKTKEIILTLELERRYSKAQILDWYLNQIPFGSNAYGVEAASQTYFQKSAAEVSLPEAAVLAAIIQAPSSLSPYGKNLPKLLERKDYVLGRMKKLGFISQEEFEKAKDNEEIKFSKIRQPIKAPHFVMYVKSLLEEKYGEDFLKNNGLVVYTSLDWKLQEIAEKVIQERSKINRSYGAFNSALLSMDVETGEILAMVGSTNFFGDPYPENCTPGKNCLFDPIPNVVLRPRQPGSAFKPFVYATAFKKGYNDKTVVVDEETNFGIFGGKPYIPQNYDMRFRGPVTLREALAQSLNVPSVKVLAYLAGLEDSINTAKEMGITTLDKPLSFYGLSLVLGGGEVTVLDMVSAYSVFANEGLKISPSPILRITDKDGKIVEENKKTPKRIISQKIACLINDILSDNQARTPIFGERSSLYIPDYQAAVKTGTTQDFKDAWAIGYTRTNVTGVWVGNSNNVSTKKPGATAAAPIWHAFMAANIEKFTKKEFTPLETCLSY